MMTKPKKVRQKVTPSPTKKPHVDPKKLVNWEKEKPSWSFSLLDPEGPWSCKNASKEVLCEEIFPKLKNFETMRWGEIKSRRHKHIPIEKLSPEAQQRLTEIEQDDVEGLVELSLGGKQRIWGILEEGKLKILWWDPEHTVCPSTKKHT